MIIKVTQHAAYLVIWVKFFQIELMVEICSKSLVGDIGKTPKGVEKWPLFVNKQLFWWSTSITLDNNNEQVF